MNQNQDSGKVLDGPACSAYEQAFNCWCFLSGKGTKVSKFRTEFEDELPIHVEPQDLISFFEQPTDEGLDETICSVSLSHEQITFLRESLERRKGTPAGINPMVDAWLEGINSEAETLLAIFTPCSVVTISQPNTESIHMPFPA